MMVNLTPLGIVGKTQFLGISLEENVIWMNS